MATDVYGRRKMYNGGFVFLLLVPIGAIAIFFLYDFGMDIYKQKQLDMRTKDVLTEVLNREGLENLDEMKIFASKVFEEYKITDDDYSLMQVDDYYLLTVYDKYISVVGELSFGFIKNKKSVASSSYKGYYNEYKEVVVEKYKENIDEALEDDAKNNEDSGIIIN